MTGQSGAGKSTLLNKIDSSLELKTDETELIDLSGKMVMPSFFDTNASIYKMIEERLKKLINSIKNYEFEVLFINDGSRDKTLELIKETIKIYKKRQRSCISFSVSVSTCIQERLSEDTV